MEETDYDLYASSPNTDISTDLSLSSSYKSNIELDLSEYSKSPNKKKKKRRSKNKYMFEQFIREETNSFEIFNREDCFIDEFTKMNIDENNFEVTPKNEKQEELLSYLEDYNIPIIFTIGPAGTGKTFLSCHYAITSYLKGECDKIIITRPAVSTDEEHGFLPGSLNDKMKPWLRPIYDIFQKYISYNHLQKLIKNETIEICPFAFMRGRTFENCVIIADETQNSTINQMKMLLTRISYGSKLIVNGDLEQSDSSRNGLKDFINRYRYTNDNNKTLIKIVEFDNSQVQRHNVIKDILNIYED
jgi:phosphate starvation-inducible PhoH-like protein